MPSWLVPALGYAISAAALVWVYWGFEWKTELPKLAAADWRWVGFAMGADVSTYFFQGWRWSLLLRPVAAAGVLRSVQAIFVGLFANSILPLRTGEILRTLLQSRWLGIPISVCLSSVLIERLVDGILIVLCFYAVTYFVEVPGLLRDASLILAIVVGLLSLLLGIAIFHKHHAHAAVSRSRWKDALRHMVEGLHAMGNSPTFVPAVFVSVIYLASQVIPIYALGRGLGLDISLGASAVVLVVLRIGTTLPEAPSNVGVFQFFAVLGLQLFGVDKGVAAGFATLLFLVMTVPLWIGGAVACALAGLRIRDLQHHARAGFSTERGSD
ncbi:MAG: lysylphosphatidylglycerol synthase transmembrane domain-containing protein [Bryobacteraceae bacterium]